MPDDTGFYVEDVCLPVSWYTIEYFKNDILFFEFEGVLKQAVIKEGNYTASELPAAISSTIYNAIGNFTAINPFTVTFCKPTNSIAISWATNYILTDLVKSFKIPTTYDLQFRGATAAGKARNCNELIRVSMILALLLRFY